MLTGPRFAAVVCSLLILFSAKIASSGDYRPTPLMKTIRKHELILTARVTKAGKGRATLSILEIIKGKPARKTLMLPDTWRPRTEMVFGPVRFEKNTAYLLFLKQTAKGEISLSRDFASKGVTRLDEFCAPIVRAVHVLYALDISKSRAKRLKILADAWRSEPDESKVILIQEFGNWKDDATVPFLIEALKSKNYSVKEHAHVVIGRHGFKAAMPTLIELLQKKKSALAARTLGELKAKDAFDALMEAAQDKRFPTNRYWVIEALGKLEDKRAVPLLLRTLRLGVPRPGKQRLWDLEQENAIEPLGRMKVAAAVDSLIAILKSDRHKGYLLQTKLVVALGEIGAPAAKAIPILNEITPDPPAVLALKKIQADLARRAKRRTR
jgi:HEAT repeat protein